MISFLNPLALLGLVAAALPLIIHFLSRWRTRRMDFSSLMLLRQVQSRNVRRLRTRQWLLLVLRTLIVALLVLVPARPAVRSLFGTGPEDHLATSAVLVLDVSASTRYVSQTGRLADGLADQARRLAGWMNPADRYRLLAADRRFREVTEDWISAGGPAPGVPVLGRASAGFGGTDLGPAIETAARLAAGESSTQAREVYVFTDRRRGIIDADSLRLPPDASIRFYIVDPGNGPQRNLAVQSVGLPGELVRPAAPIKLTAIIAHYGGTEAAQVFPRVYLDGRLVGQGEAVVPPEDSVPAVIELPPLEPGLHELAVEIDADGLAADNRRSLTVDVPERSRVVLVEPARPPIDYLGAALEVLSRGQSPAISLARSPQLPASAGEISRADVFILHGTSLSRSRLTAFLGEAARAGAGILVLPNAAEGEDADREFSAAATRLALPVELGVPTGFGSGGYDTPAGPAAGAAASAAQFGALFEAMAGLERVRLFTLRGLPPGTGGSAESTQAAAPPAAADLTTKGGSTLLRLVRTGRARLLVAAVDLASPEETELPGTPLFVPLLHSVITLLTDTGPLVRKELTVGEPAGIYFGEPAADGSFQVQAPEGGIHLLLAGSDGRVSFDAVDRPGTYRIFRDQRQVGAFSAGLDPAESDVRPESEEVLRRKFGDVPLTFVGGREELAEKVFLARGGVEVWPGLLIAALVLLGVEQVLANRKEKSEDK
ncbi:MAG: BatA domain-containing protein [Candidatus Glassbacteria bacterium]